MTLDEALDTLACELEKRPKGAPSFFDLAGAVRGVRREEGAVVVEYDAAARASVEALVAAERACCSQIGWDLQQQPALRLRITATAPQLDVFEQMLRNE